MCRYTRSNFINKIHAAPAGLPDEAQTGYAQIVLAG